MDWGFDEQTAKLIAAVVAAIEPMLAGLPSPVQGAALADLTATWLAGHRSDDPRELKAFRGEIMELQTETIWSLVASIDEERQGR